MNGVTKKLFLALKIRHSVTVEVASSSWSNEPLAVLHFQKLKRAKRFSVRKHRYWKCTWSRLLDAQASHKVISSSVYISCCSELSVSVEFLCLLSLRLIRLNWRNLVRPLICSLWLALKLVLQGEAIYTDPGQKFIFVAGFYWEKYIMSSHTW